jgi:dienelactone hydrolase
MVMLHQYLPLRRWRLNVHREFRRLRAFSKPALMALAMTLFVSLAYGAVRDERPFTVDDLLKLSDVGRAAVRPGTNTFVWEQSPPYDTLGDYGAGTSGTWYSSDYEIFTVESGSNVPRKLFQPRERTTYQLGDFSNDGRFLTLLAICNGEVRAAVFDFQQQQLREFPLAPRFLLNTELKPDWVWLDNRHLAIAAYPDGEGPWRLTFRRAIGSHLTQSWEKSWKGQEASVDQYDSSEIDVDRPLPGRLVVVDAESGHIQQLASGQFSALRPSPDGRWLAAVRQSMLPQSTLEHPHIDWTYARSVLTVFSLTGSPGEREISPDLDVLPDSMEWDPSSKRLAFFASHAGTELRSGDFWIADPSSSAATVVPHAGLSLASQRARGGPQWPERAVWFNDSLAVFARSTPGQPGTLTFEAFEGRGVTDSRVGVLSVPAHWFLLSAHSAPSDLTPGMQQVSPIPVLANGTRFIVVSDGQAWSLDASAPPSRLFSQFDQRLDATKILGVLTKTNGGEGFLPIMGEPGKLARIEIDDGSPALKLVTTPPGTSVLAIAKSGMALAQIGVGKGAGLALIGPDGAGLRILGELNPFLDQIAETRWTHFDYSNAAGSQRAHLSGCLLLPTDYQSGHRYPLIVEVYPDRPGGCGSPQFRGTTEMAARPAPYSEHLLAARGFIVFRPDTGGAISRTAAGPQAALSEVVDRGVDAVIAAGYGDPDRIGLMGFSQGGFASLWIATQSHRYKAVVSLNGWSDLTSDFFKMDWAQQLAPTEIRSEGDEERYLTSAGSDFVMGGTPWKFPERYIQNSPLWRSDTVSAPVLLIHSDMDGFDVTSYKEFFTSLYIQKKDARLLIYRGEGHGPSSPANIRHMWKNIFSWFDRYLNVKRDSNGKMVLAK